MTRQEADELERVLAHLIHHERVTLRMHFEAELSELRGRVHKAEKALADLETEVAGASDVDLANIRFLRARR